jgi:signal transduction histidine kinase
MPLLLAASFVFGPWIGGGIAFLGFVDPREFSGSISVARGLFNRAQTSLSVIVAGGVFRVFGGDIGQWPRVALAALAAVGIDYLVNHAMVVVAIRLHDGGSFRRLAAVLSVGSYSAFIITYVSYGFLSVLLAEIYTEIGVWGLASFVVPVLLAWQAFSQGQQLGVADERIRLQSDALRDASDRIVDERRDERLSVAAGLHDEVLPPLYKVHLMGQVLRQDFLHGRLLDLERDSPELVRATEQANDAIRMLMSDLRESALGTKGLAETLRLLGRALEVDSPARIVIDADEVGGSHFTQLMAYQIAREALRNAATHAHATTIKLRVFQDGDWVRLVVEDDGIGFDQRTADDREHVGLRLMLERVELAGGTLQVDSATGMGTLVVAKLPGIDPDRPG